MVSKTYIYEPWIDILKGIAIIMVILQHIGFGTTELFQWYHIGQSVPIFLFCSAYLLGKKKVSDYFTANRLKCLWKRVILPFIIVTFLIFIALVVLNSKKNWEEGVKNLSFFMLLKEGLIEGGFGPGSYYPWMYIQFWFAVPLFKWIIEKCVSLWKSFFLMLTISIMLEVIFYFAAGYFSDFLAAPIWRLCFVRYVMLIWVGICFNEIIKNKAFWSLLAMGSLILGTIDIYLYPQLSPFGWNGFHWFSEFYIIPFILVLRKVKSPFLQTLGKYSWEIFLVQMAWFALPLTGVPELVFDKLGFGEVALYSSRLLYIEISMVAIVMASYVWIQIKTRHNLTYRNNEIKNK